MSMGIDMGIGMEESVSTNTGVTDACIGGWTSMGRVESLRTVIDRAHTGAALQTRHLRHGRRRPACSTHRKATTLATTTVRLLSLLSLLLLLSPRRAGKSIYHRAIQHHLAIVVTPLSMLAMRLHGTTKGMNMRGPPSQETGMWQRSIFLRLTILRT